MPIVYEVDELAAVAMVCSRGYVTPDATLELLDRQRADPRMIPIRAQIIDTRHSTAGNFDLSSLRKLGDAMKRRSEERVGAPIGTAFIVEGAIQFAMGKMLVKFSGSADRMTVVRTIPEACDFLGVSAVVAEQLSRRLTSALVPG
jgi:hypothetical protein